MAVRAGTGYVDDDFVPGPRRQIVRAPSRRAATAEQVLIFILNSGIGGQAVPRKNASQRVKYHFWSRNDRTGLRRKVVVAYKRATIEMTPQMRERFGYRSLLLKNEKPNSWKISYKVSGLCEVCSDYTGSTRKLASCTFAWCEERRIEATFSLDHEKSAGRYICPEDRDEVRSLRRDVIRRTEASSKHEDKWRERLYARRNRDDERAKAGILAAAGN